MLKWALVAAAAWVWACTVPADMPAGSDTANMGGTGGAASGGSGSGGVVGTGGVLGTGGMLGTGGALGTGGMPDAGGAPGTGGDLGTGGVAATGGMPGTGGVVATGGTPGTGGIVATGGTPGTGGIVATGGTPGTGGTSSGLTDTARFNFESNTQNWVDLGGGASRETGLAPVQSADRSYAGDRSLRYPIVVTKNGTSERIVGVVAGNIGDLPPGKTITFQVWVPPGHKITSLQGFAQTRAANSWQQDQRTGAEIGTAAWTQLSVPIPASFAGQEPLELGVRVTVNGQWSGDVYIDTVRVQ